MAVNTASDRPPHETFDTILTLDFGCVNLLSSDMGCIASRQDNAKNVLRENNC